MKKLLGLLFIVLSFAVNAQVNPAFNSVRFTGSDSTGFNVVEGTLRYNPTTKRLRVYSDGAFRTVITDNIDGGGSGISGLTSGRIPFATSGTTIGDDADLTWDNTNKVLVLGGPPSGGMSIFADYTPNRDNLIFSDGMNNWAGVLGLDNFGVGSGALYSLYAGNHNHAIGAAAGGILTDGEHNELIGRAAGGSLVNGSGNIIIGAYSDISASSSGNVLLGYNQQGPTTGGQHVLIGYNVESVHPTANGELSIQNAIFGVGNTAGTTSISTGNIGLYVQSPTARLHLPAGAAAAGNAPLKLTTGTALTTPEDGAIEYHGSHLYFTIGSTRYQIDQQAGGSGWAVTGTTTLTGGVTIAQAGNDILFHNGNILFGPTSSTITANTKVDIRGTGTGTNKAFRIADSGNTQRLQILDNGRATFYSSSALAGGTDQIFHFDQVNTTGNPTNGAFMRLSPDVRTSGGTSSNWMTLDLDGFYYHGSAATQSATGLRIKEDLSSWVAAYNAIKFETSHVVSSGTGTHANLNIVPTYNFTSTYSGNVYGLLYNPTLTSMTGVTHIAAAFASGDVVIGSSTPTTSAALDVQSTTKAFIPPRMTETQRDAITSPSAGMIIYNTTTNVLNFYNGSSWGAI